MSVRAPLYSCIAYVIAASIAVFVTLPVAVVFYQPTEFDLAPIDVALIGAVVALASSAILIALGSVPFRPLRALIGLVAKVAIILVSLFAFLVPIASGEQLGDQTPLVLTTELWIEFLVYLLAVVAIVIFVALSRRIVPSVVFALAMICVSFSLYAGATGGKSQIAKRVALEEQLPDFASLSGKQNILIVLLDELRGKLVYETLLSEPALQDNFEGFTFFTDSASVAPRTAMSLPNILSATYYDGGLVQRWMTRSTSEDGFLIDALASGFDPHYLQTMGAPCDDVKCLPATAFSVRTARSDLFIGYVNVFRLGLMRSLPRALHESLSEENVNNYAFAILSTWSSASDHILTEPERHFYSLKNFTEALRLDPALERRLTFVHVTFTHLPVDFDRDCNYSSRSPTLLQNVMDEIYCGVSQMVAITNKLKKIGAYDNTTIFFISDHGENTLYYHTPLSVREMPYVPGEEEHYHNTIMIKPAGETGPIKFSSAPASLVDLRKTICSFMPGCKVEVAGENLMTLKEGTDRERTIMRFRYGKGLLDSSGGYPADSYEFLKFNGSIPRLARAMFIPHKYTPGELIEFGKDGNGMGYTFTGWSMPQEGQRFADARSDDAARLAMDLTEVRDTPLKLLAAVDAYVSDQDVEVIANGETVASWHVIAGGGPEELTAVIPADVVKRKNPLELAFKPSNPTAAPSATDPRMVSIMMRTMKLEYIDLLEASPSGGQADQEPESRL